MTETIIEIIQPDDWHVHLREDKLLEVVSKYSFRINNRCIVMPNLETPMNHKKGVRSLNLSVACGIAIYEAHKQINFQNHN